MKARYLIILITLIPLQSFCQQEEAQTLNDLVNKSIDSFIRNQPPKIKFILFVDGKKINSSLHFTVNYNNRLSRNSTKNSVTLDTTNIISNDSISFFLKYKHQIFSSENLALKIFKHGGEIIFGIVSDYKSLIEKYKSDPVKYLHDNNKNWLYDFALFSLKKYPNIEIGTHYYLVLHNNFTEWMNVYMNNH